jgi:prophage tail gpP-like protein
MLELKGSARFLLWLTVAQCLSHAVHAEAVYQWKDKDGQTVFSQRPPQNAKATRVQAHAGKPAVDSNQRLADQRKQLSPSAPASKAEKPLTPEEQAKLKDACAQAKNALKLLQENNRPRYIDSNGQLDVMTAALKAERIADAKRKANDYCR